MSKHSIEQQLFKKQKNNKKSKEIPLETYEDIEDVTKEIKFIKEQQNIPELKCSKELSQAFKEHDLKRVIYIKKVMKIEKLKELKNILKQ